MSLTIEQENKIIELYQSGMGSTTITKELKIGKAFILKLLNDKNILRNRKKDDEYKDFIFEDGQWNTFWTCNECNNQIKASASKPFYLNRNIKKINIKNSVCKACSLKKQVGEGNPFYGKSHSEETRNHLSKIRKGGNYGQHTKTPEFREETSKRMKLFFKTDEGILTKEKYSLRMKESIKLGLIKGFNRSKAEDELIEILTTNNIICIASFKIESKIFDIHIPKHNLLVEYNGDYWHCNPNKYSAEYFNHKKQMTAQQLWDYDGNKIDLAKNKGYNVETIWESDYKNNKNIILEIIKTYESRK